MRKMGRGLERGTEDSPTELRGPWQVQGSRRVQHSPLVSLLLPHLPRQRRGEPSGAVRRQPGPARRRRRGSRRRIPVLIWSWDSPGPAPRPRPAGRPRLAVGRGEPLALGVGNGVGEGIPRCRPRSSRCPGTLPQFPLLVTAVNELTGKPRITADYSVGVGVAILGCGKLEPRPNSASPSPSGPPFHPTLET